MSDKLNLDILTPRFPTRRPLGPARLILRSQRIQVWLKTERLAHAKSKQKAAK